VKGVADLYIDSREDNILPLIPLKTKDAKDLINDPEIDIICELIGGYEPAKSFITAALQNGKHVVTANKALLAVHGEELFSLAAEKGLEIGFEASVGGGIPIIKVLKEDLAVNNITEITAIINGTANYILSRMQQEGASYADVLKDAQRLGYAEADPSFDVQGTDSTHKLTLLSSIAFGTWVDFKKVYTEGITDISSTDVEFAKELGCTIKLLAIGKKHADGVEVRVHPTMIPMHYQLASVNDAFNAVQVQGDFVDKTLHYGRGAGSRPTGSAVAGDVINIARNIASGSCATVPALGFTGPIAEKFPVKDINDIGSSFYLRFNVEDHPGVLSATAGILAKNGISIRSALQRPPLDDSEDILPLVFLTHEATGRQISGAVEEIDKLAFIKEKTVVIRVEGVK
jgi:homoserine dehydrogenase